MVSGNSCDCILVLLPLLKIFMYILYLILCTSKACCYLVKIGISFKTSKNPGCYTWSTGILGFQLLESVMLVLFPLAIYPEVGLLDYF